jgi:hypothetical protein
MDAVLPFFPHLQRLLHHNRDSPSSWPAPSGRRASLYSQDIAASPWHALSCVKPKRKAVTRRHDRWCRVCQLLCRFARSNDCSAHVVQKDLAHLLPDGEIQMFYRTVDFDVTGVNTHAPSYVDMAPGKAMIAREKYKIGKYGTHSQQATCKYDHST